MPPTIDHTILYSFARLRPRIGGSPRVLLRLALAGAFLLLMNGVVHFHRSGGVSFSSSHSLSYYSSLVNAAGGRLVASSWSPEKGFLSPPPPPQGGEEEEGANGRWKGQEEGGEGYDENAGGGGGGVDGGLRIVVFGGGGPATPNREDGDGGDDDDNGMGTQRETWTDVLCRETDEAGGALVSNSLYGTALVSAVSVGDGGDGGEGEANEEEEGEKDDAERDKRVENTGDASLTTSTITLEQGTTPSTPASSTLPPPTSPDHENNTHNKQDEYYYIPWQAQHYPVPRQHPDLLAQIETFLSLSSSSSSSSPPPRDTLWVLDLGYWDAWYLAALPRVVAAEVVEVQARHVVAQLDLLWREAAVGEGGGGYAPSVAFSGTRRNLLRNGDDSSNSDSQLGKGSAGVEEMGGGVTTWGGQEDQEEDNHESHADLFFNDDDDAENDEDEYSYRPSPFRVLIPQVFDISLTPGFASRRAAESSRAEQMRNAAFVTARWNELMRNLTDEWVAGKAKGVGGREEEGEGGKEAGEAGEERVLMSGDGDDDGFGDLDGDGKVWGPSRALGNGDDDDVEGGFDGDATAENSDNYGDIDGDVAQKQEMTEPVDNASQNLYSYHTALERTTATTTSTNRVTPSPPSPSNINQRNDNRANNHSPQRTTGSLVHSSSSPSSARHPPPHLVHPLSSHQQQHQKQKQKQQPPSRHIIHTDTATYLRELIADRQLRNTDLVDHDHSIGDIRGLGRRPLGEGFFEVWEPCVKQQQQQQKQQQQQQLCTAPHEHLFWTEFTVHGRAVGEIGRRAARAVEVAVGGGREEENE